MIKQATGVQNLLFMAVAVAGTTTITNTIAITKMYLLFEELCSQPINHRLTPNQYCQNFLHFD